MIQVVDFFCGAGGLTRGFLDAGLEVVAGIDREPRCRETYEFNNPSVKYIEADVVSLTLGELREEVSLTDRKDVLFAACAPCQPFSTQRKSKYQRTDATVLGHFGRLVEEALPGHILIENVPGLARVRGYSTFRRFLSLLERNRYRYVYGSLDAKDYGVPQNRRRLVLIATRFGVPQLPKSRFGQPNRPYNTVRRVISHLPGIEAGREHPRVPNHVSAALSDINLERLRHTPRDGGDRKSWPEHLKLECHKNGYGGHTDVYGRMYWDRPAPALTGRCHSISNGRYGHPEQDRAISLREAAAIQSFPDGYVFFGSNKHIAMQIGNAIPVKLAECLGKQIMNIRDTGRIRVKR